MAGVLAAQSIGEPATQMTLNVSILSQGCRHLVAELSHT